MMIMPERCGKLAMHRVNGWSPRDSAIRARRARATCRWQGARAASAQAQAAADPGGAACATEGGGVRPGGAEGDARWGGGRRRPAAFGAAGRVRAHPAAFAAGRWPGGWRRRDRSRRIAAFRALPPPRWPGQAGP